MNDDDGFTPISFPDQKDAQSTPPAMEVHHHAHNHGKRSVSSYFWEFLMLFLAVFCGFLAEYKLEHTIEHQREKTFMNNLVEDLGSDEKILLTYTEWRNAVSQDFDSLLILLSSPDPNQYAHRIYEKGLRSGLRFGLPDINEGTIQQLNAGGLRLIRQREVVNSINDYYMQVTRMRASYETERLIRVQLVGSGAGVFDARQSMDMKQPPESYQLLSTDRTVLNQYMHQVMAARLVNKGLITHLDSVRVRSVRLKELIGEKYH